MKEDTLTIISVVISPTPLPGTHTHTPTWHTPPSLFVGELVDLAVDEGSDNHTHILLHCIIVKTSM